MCEASASSLHALHWSTTWVYWVHLLGAMKMHRARSPLGWMVLFVTRDSDRGPDSQGVTMQTSLSCSHCRANKRCPHDRLFSGKNSLTRLTRNAVICKAFPAKRFISCPWGKRPAPFSSRLTRSLMLLISSLCWWNSVLLLFLHALHTVAHNNRQKPCSKCSLVYVREASTFIVCMTLHY